MLELKIRPGHAGLLGGNLPEQSELDRLAQSMEGTTLAEIEPIVYAHLLLTDGYQGLGEDEQQVISGMASLFLQTAFDNLARLHDREALVAIVQQDPLFMTYVELGLGAMENTGEKLLQAEVALLSCIYYQLAKGWELDE